MNQWDKMAIVYDEMVGEIGDIPNQRLLNPLIRQFLGNFSGQIILDAGCGNGYWARFLAQKAKKVVGIDNSRELLKIARSKNNPSNLTFKLADLNKPLPFESESFDTIISNMALHYVQKIKIASRELHRILKKKGKLIFSIAHPKYESAKKKDLKGIRKRKKFYTKTLGGRGVLAEYYWPLSDCKKIFKNAGFNLVGFKEPLITDGLAREYPRYKKFAGLPRAAIFCWRK